MKILYIGQFEEGSTSRMRGEYLREILGGHHFEVVDTRIPMEKTAGIFRSLGWRFYKGPLIGNINGYLRTVVESSGDYDLVWIDKGVFLDPKNISSLKRAGNLLVHYTPDTAFTYNRSSLFFNSLRHYDYCITTKSFEIQDYEKMGAKNVLFCTQGYDKHLHKPYHSFDEKQGVCFIGLHEPVREKIITSILETGISVKLAGANWEKFVKRNSGNPGLKWYGRGLFGTDYAKLISGSLMGLGLLSKKFPELHTTRTFEIPACGTALITERNAETTRFYSEEDVIFFDRVHELPAKISRIYTNKERLQQVTDNGHRKVTQNQYDYKSILSKLLKEMNILN